MTSGGKGVASGEREARRLSLATYLAVGLAFAVVNALSELDERSRAGRPVDAWEPWCWELTSLAMRRLVLRAQAKKERQHRRDRKLLMQYEKQRAEMRKNMGLNPVLG